MDSAWDDGKGNTLFPGSIQMGNEDRLEMFQMKYTRQDLEGKAQTVLGPISVDELGITLSHEHCLIDGTCDFVEPKEITEKKIANEPLSFKNVGYIRYGRFNRDDMQLADEKQCINELLPFKYAGGRTIVDATNVDLGRDPLALKRISLATGLNIIMGSGYYTQKGQDLHLMEKRTEEDIADEIMRDIFEGVGNTGVHSGIIGEIGCSWPLEDSERKVLRAAGMAQKESGAPLHIHPGRFEEAPVEIIKILKEIGTDLSHTAINHFERTVFEPNNRYMIADSGCYLEYDLWGIEGYYNESFAVLDIPNDTQRIAQIRDLIAHGYGSQILISHDICQKCHYMAFGGHGYNHILNNVVPAMRRREMTERQINDLLIENPKRFLAFT
jgi:phosphotriesterase-related protein